MKEKLLYISYLRVMAMLIIVFYHCFCCYSGIWSTTRPWVAFEIPFYHILGTLLLNFHLPLFTIVAGYLYSFLAQQGHYEDKRKFIIGKVKRLLVPYIIVGTFIIILQDRPILQIVNGFSHLWYLLFLFGCFVIVTLLKIKDPPPKNLYKISAALYLWAIVAVRWSPHLNFLCIDSMFKYMPYFLIGMVLALPYCRERYRSTKIGWAWLLAIIISTICLIVKQMEVSWAIDHIASCVSYIILPLISILFFLWIRNMQQLSDGKVLSYLDRWSMGIYIVHHIYIQEINSIQPFHEWMMQYPWLYPFFLFAVVLPLSIVTVWLIQRFKWGKYVVG